MRGQKVNKQNWYLYSITETAPSMRISVGVCDVKSNVSGCSVLFWCMLCLFERM